MEIANTVLVEMGKYLLRPLEAQVCYLSKFHDNVKDLKKKAEDLATRKDDIEGKVAAGLSTGEKETQEVALWLKRAVDILQETKEIEQRAVRDDKRWFCCPNLKWRYNISKQAKEKLEIVANHHEQGRFDRVTMPARSPPVVSLPAPSIHGLTSRELAMKKVMEALDDEKVKIIGVWGMAGVGKTTLVKNLNNRMLGTHQYRFQRVIMVIVSKEFNLKRLQGDIAKRLGYYLRDEDEPSRAIDLRNRLIEERRFLIILDDVWDGLDLASVGIPLDDSVVQDCKLIITTRREVVCRKMETQVNIKVELLSDSESWILFKEKAGDVVDEPTLHVVAKELLRECGGLPLAIITVGRALRGVRDPVVWDNALTQMKRSEPSDIEDMAMVYQSLRVSYEFLRLELRPAFLFCCLFPEDYNIPVDRMIRYWIGEGFLKGAGDLEEKQKRGHSWVEELKASCLLLEDEIDDFIRMHDVARDVAISIVSKHDETYKSLARGGLGLKSLPLGQNWDEYKRISLMRNGISKLPKGLHCPQLLTLMIQENKELQELPDCFFEGSKSLRVLDLSETSFCRLPSSLCSLVNLRFLCLRSCKFEEGASLSPLGGLKQLESLDLGYNDSLCELPTEIRELVNLRSLDLTHTSSLTIMPRGVLSQLTRLEELKMLGSFSMWEVEGAMEDQDESSSSSSNATLAEVANLSELYSLSLHIADADRFPQGYGQLRSLENLKRFHIYIFESSYTALAYSITLGYSGASYKRIGLVGCSHIPGWVNMLLPRTTLLILHSCEGLRSLGDGGKFLSLRRLDLCYCHDLECLSTVPSTWLQTPARTGLIRILVKECDRMEHVFVGTPSSQQDNALSRLGHLALENQRNTRGIWATGIAGMLPNLTKLDIQYCDGLKKRAFSSRQLNGGLPNLKELTLGGCFGIEEVISDVVNNEGLLPKLIVLDLFNLPELVRIYGGNGDNPPLQLDWHSLKILRVNKCPKLTKLQPLQGGANGVPLLREINGEKDWWEGLDWDGNDANKAHFQRFFTEERVKWRNFRAVHWR